MAHASVKRPHETRTTEPRGAVALVLVLFLAAYGWLQYNGIVSTSATYDEPLHLTAGYIAMHQREHRLDPTHPPLLRMWASLPLWGQPVPRVDLTGALQLTVDDMTNRSYAVARQVIFGRGKGDELLIRGRAMIAILGALLGLVVFYWARQWLGFVPAVVALWLYALEPNLLAHSALVTTDAGVVCFMFAAIYFLWRLQREWTWSHLLLMAFCTAFAVVSKFSGLVLAPIIVLLLAASVLSKSEITLRRALFVCAILFAVSFLAIWAAYQFRFEPSPARTFMRIASAPTVQRRLPLLGELLAWINAHRLLPNAYTQGLAWSVTSAQGLGGYLNGEVSNEGWWYYFPVAFLLKTPLPLLILFFAGFILLWRRTGRAERLNRLFVVVPLVVYLGVAIDSRINIGIRHLLPLYPFVILAAAFAASEFLTASRRLGRVAVALTAAAATVVFMRAWPNTIAYFNEFIGAPRNGYLYLSDSNLDWGQHLKRLKRWMDRHDIKRINLAYFGSVDPAVYGIQCVYLPGSPPVAPQHEPELPGYVAISPTILTSWREALYGGFNAEIPVAVIGNAIRVYWVEEWPEPGADEDYPSDWELATADELFTNARWYDEAAVHYKNYLDDNPRNGVVWERRGIALFNDSQLGAAVDAFDHAVELAPDKGQANLRIGELLLRARQPLLAEKYALSAVGLRPHDAKARELLEKTIQAARQGR